MARLLGHVDERDRPIVRLPLDGEEDDLPVIVDTGFNGQLLINDTEIARLKCEIMEIEVPVELADRERRMLLLARSRIVWLGRPREIQVWIATGGASRAALPDEPVGLIGTALLKPHKLTVDFATRRVTIDQAEQ